VSALEAAWRLLSFSLHREQPNVVRLAVHLPDQQMVVFNPDPSPHNPHSGLESVNAKTSLTSWFAFNKKAKADAEMWAAVVARANHPDAAARAEAAAKAAEARALWDECQNTLYRQFPKIATLNNKVWKRRVLRMARDPVGRMYYVPPTAGERFYLRLCLTHVPGATCFEDVRTFQGRVCATFKEAAIARGLLQDNGEWRAALEEAAFFASAAQLRALFANILAFNEVTEPPALWEEFKEHMADDFLHLARTAPGGDPARAFDADIFDQCLRALDGLLRGMGSPNTLADLHLPVPAAAPAGALLAEERAAYDPTAQAAERERRLPTLNPAQRAVYDTVMAAVASARAERRAAASHPLMRRPPLAGAVAIPPRAFFVDGLGGSGKTYLYGCLLASVRAEAGGVCGDRHCLLRHCRPAARGRPHCALALYDPRRGPL
jgi:hypothetical protein